MLLRYILSLFFHICFLYVSAAACASMYVFHFCFPSTTISNDPIFTYQCFPLGHWNILGLKSFGVSRHTRFSAIEYNDGLTQQDRFFSNRLSHIACIQNAWEAGLERVAICEDDVVFDARFINSSILDQIVYFLDNNEWDIFYLGLNEKNPSDYTDNPHVKRVLKGWAIHCYLVNRRAYKRLLEAHKYTDISVPCDVMFHKTVQLAGKCYVSSPRLALQREGFSYAVGKHKNYDRCLKECTNFK